MGKQVSDTAEDLAAFAITTGEFYERHCTLARDTGDNLLDWTNHVKKTVVPLYIRQVGRIDPKLSVLVSTAKNLRGYYRQHIAEVARDH